MTDDEKVRGCIAEFEPGERAPVWLSVGLVGIVVVLVLVAIWCWRVIAG